MSRTVKLLFGMVLLALITHSAAEAGIDDPFNPIDADALINGCVERWQADLDSGVTVRMRSGSAAIIDCYEDVIQNQAEEMFEPESLSRQELRSYLDDIKAGYQKLYWAIFNKHKKCDTLCGTDKQVYHLGAHMALLERIIRDMAAERNEARF